MKKKMTHQWITFETKITELEMNKSEMMETQTQFQEETKSAVLDALVINDFDTAQALTKELKAYKNGDATDIENKIQFLKDRQQKVREIPERDPEYRESILKNDVLYTHALEIGDQETVELFRQRKISTEEVYQNLMDAYYGNIFDTSKQEWWKSIRKKLQLISSDQDVGGILQQMGIDYNTTRVDEFYESETQEWSKAPATKSSKQINFIKEGNIIQELLMYLQAHAIVFEQSEIILNRRGTTMYIYIQWIDKTIVISNIYGIWTHVYQWKVDIQEMQNGTIGLLCKKYRGKKINFWPDFWWMEWRKCRFIKTLQENNESTVVLPKDERNINSEKIFSSLREKIDDFSAKKSHIKHSELNIEEKYEGMITWIKPPLHWLGWRVYVGIGKDIFGYYSYREASEFTHMKLWDVVTVKIKTIREKGMPIVFKRPE